jgi:hypothetical protein
MTTRYEAIKAALLAQLERQAPGFKGYYGYEPLAVYEPPLLYVLFIGFDDATHNQQVDRTYRYLVRGVFRWVDVEQAELEIDPFVDLLPTAIYTDIMLDGAVSRGRATVERIAGAFLQWNGDGPVFRCLDMTVAVTDKVPWAFSPPGQGRALL